MQKNLITKIHDTLPLITTLNFTVDKVLHTLVSLHKSKACGPDLIPARLLKEGVESICASLANLYQMSTDILVNYHLTGRLPMLFQSLNTKTNTSHQITGQ